MQDIMWFGKYQGLHYRDVIRDSPAYALWAHENVRGFCLSPFELQQCIAATDIGPRRGRTTPDWMDDDGPDEYAGMSYSDFGNN